MTDYRYDQSPLSKGLMGAGQALSGISDAMIKAADLKKKSQVMDEQIKQSKMQYSALKLKNIQSLPKASLRQTALMSKSGQEAWQGMFGTDIDEDTAELFSGDYVSDLTIKMYDAIKDIDLNDPQASKLMASAFTKIPEFKNDPASAIAAMDSLKNYKKTEAGILETYGDIEYKRQQARKEGSLADLYAGGHKPGYKDPNKTPGVRPVTNLQKFNTVSLSLSRFNTAIDKARSDMQDAAKLMADIENKGGGNKESNPDLKSDQYINAKNIYTRATADIDKLNKEVEPYYEQLQRLQPLIDSDPNGVYSTPNMEMSKPEPQEKPAVVDVPKVKKTVPPIGKGKPGAQVRFQQLKKAGFTDEDANIQVKAEYAKGLLTKDWK